MSKFDVKKGARPCYSGTFFAPLGGSQIKKTPPEGTYLNIKKKQLKETTCWQGTTSQGKHALGAFGIYISIDLIATANVPLRALGGLGVKVWGIVWLGNWDYL